MGETRSVKQSIPGKQRNYVLDFMKVVAAFTVVFVHTTQNIFPSEVQVSGASGLFNYWSVTSDVGFWPRGFYTLLIYEILSFIGVAPSSFLGLPFQQLSMGVVGFWIWYAVDALKAGEVSPVVRKFLGWAKLILVALHLSHFIFGWSNRLGEGIMWAFSLIITLANIDWFTNFFNRIFSKMKTAKYWGDWALGLFLFHYPMFPLCKYVLVPRFGWFAGAWMCVGLVCVAAAAFIPFYHKITKPISAFLTKLLLLDRPVGEMLKKEKKAN